MSRWKSSFAISLVINLAIFAGGAVYMKYAAPEATVKLEAIEMEIVSDSDAPSAGPQIEAPKPEKVEVPPPPTPEEVQQIKESGTIPVNDDNKQEDNQPKPPVQNPTQNTNRNRFQDSNANNAQTGPSSGGENDKPPKQDQSHGPKRLDTPTPNIPEIPKDQAVSDTIVASIRIEADGSVSDVTLTQPSGYGPADNAVISTLSGWSFYPATDEDGNAIAVTVPQRFSVRIK